VNPDTLQILATVLFCLAILHTFAVKQFNKLAKRFPEGSVPENLLHLLGEVEVVFGLWAGVLFIVMMLMKGQHQAVQYLEGLNYTEPAFVFVIMTMAATRPVLVLAERLIEQAANRLPISKPQAFYFTTLVIGPLLGSFITEPAAMTVTAMILLKKYYQRGMSKRFMYITLAVLFVNVSIGGVLTPFAAPPVLMVAGKWNWSMRVMLGHFGWKAVLAVMLNGGGALFLLRHELRQIQEEAVQEEGEKLLALPWWMFAAHVLAMGVVVFFSHHMVVFMGFFLFFLGFVQVTKEYQSELKLKEALLVGFFLGGLVILGAQQQWWLQSLIAKMDSFSLFMGATGLTAVTDNAALTYLGSLVEGLSDASKYALVAGAISGGGLTVIANAPNPAGYGILKEAFGDEGVSPFGLLLAATPPTLIAVLCLWMLPNL